MTTRLLFHRMVRTAMARFLFRRRLSIVAGQRKRQGPMSFYTFLSYFTGLYFIRPDLDAAMLLRTAALVHLLDAILCGLIAGSSGRSRVLWTLAGFGLGIWALAALFLLPAQRPPVDARDRPPFARPPPETG